MAHHYEPLFFDAGRCHLCNEPRKHHNHGYPPFPEVVAERLAKLRQTYPEAVVHFDRTARDCGYPRPWMVWSDETDEAKCLGDGATESEALGAALQEMGCPDCGNLDHDERDCPAKPPHPILDPREP